MTKPLRVCVLLPSYEGSKAQTRAWDDVICTPANVLKGDTDFEFTNVQILKATSYSQVRMLVHSGKYDVFFNQCDGSKDEDRAGLSVVTALEEFGVAFTGSTSAHYEPSKLEMKMLAFYAGIKVPAFAHIVVGDDIGRICAHLKYPVIVKHVSGYGSVGMTKDSKCDDLVQLRKEAARFLDMFCEVLVEEYIDGPEVNVLAFEDLDGRPIHALKPIQICFPDGETFKHFDLKWIGMLGHQLGKSLTDENLARKCQDIGRRAFEHIIGGIGYGRSDLRVCAKTGEVYLLEINPNCGLFYPEKDGTADLIMENDPTFNAAAVAKHLIHASIARNKRRLAKVAPCDAIFHPDIGYHICANRAITEGEIVFRNEATPYTIVTKNYVKNNWNTIDSKAFAQYAWPISTEVFATWHADPNKWRPINHSCDPNLWFGEDHSLDVYARRDIAVGEQLTMDYATFCSGPLMHPFKCQCNTASCRQQITPLDYYQSEQIRELFGTRVTDYVYHEYHRNEPSK